MADNHKEIATQSYEKKIARTLLSEKFQLPIYVKNKSFIDSLDLMPVELVQIANKFYKDRISKVYEEFVNKFDELVVPLISEKGINTELPEEEIQKLIALYDIKINRFIEIITLYSKIKDESFYHKDLIEQGWSLCLNGMAYLPLMMAMGSKRIIVLDESFSMNLMSFAEMGAMPDIKPITKVGNIAVPPETYSVNLQFMVGNSFKQVLLVLFKQKFESISKLIPMMSNISMVGDFKSEIEEDFSGLKWVKNSYQYSLFKRKDFLELFRNLNIGSLVIDKAVSPMQVQKIPTLVKGNANLNIGFDIHKIGTLQYSILQKKDNTPIMYDIYDSVICRASEFHVSSETANKFSTM
ncbi:MAG: hypothetical protein ACK4IX_07045 [Candidatus Sericytochromatia bacterium]